MYQHVLFIDKTWDISPMWHNTNNMRFWCIRKRGRFKTFLDKSDLTILTSSISVNDGKGYHAKCGSQLEIAVVCLDQTSQKGIWSRQKYWFKPWKNWYVSVPRPMRGLTNWKFYLLVTRREGGKNNHANGNMNWYLTNRHGVSRVTSGRRDMANLQLECGKATLGHLGHKPDKTRHLSQNPISLWAYWRVFESVPWDTRAIEDMSTEMEPGKP